MALVSGLGMGDQGGETASVALLVDYLAGLLGGAKEHEQVAKVGRSPQKVCILLRRLDCWTLARPSGLMTLCLLIKTPCEQEAILTSLVSGADRADGDSRRPVA